MTGRTRELTSFFLVGACAYASDLALFVLLRGPLGQDPLPAKAFSFVAGCTVAYVGNALGTYRNRGHGRRVAWRQYAVFSGINAAGALVQLLCLAVSHYVLGLTSPRADAAAGLGVGMVLATCLRFWATRTFVFGSGFAREGRRTSWTG
ncbi:GtrA family protein [Streptomyces sp. NPDC059176]|uniref:GtrA family protein n=1 Tax=unclassified Streptomyces TaxID=2593676 RepID=UPI003675D69E